MTANEVEILVAEFWGYRRNLIVPNVSWGWGIRYEADMVIVPPSNWAIEIEIKVTASDISRDRLKRHCHNCNRFRKLYFAVPHELAGHPDIPGNAGIIDVTVPGGGVSIIREAKPNKFATKIDASQRLKLAELGSMRVWDLKRHLRRNNP